MFPESSGHMTLNPLRPEFTLIPRIIASQLNSERRNLRGEVANVEEFGIVVKEFEL